MKKFVLDIKPEVLSPDAQGRFQQLMTLRRPFTDLKIYLCENYVRSRLTDVVERYGRNVINFSLESELLPLDVLLEILQHFPELEKLTLDFWMPYDREIRPVADDSLSAVTLKKLKTIVVEDWNVFQLIWAPALVEIEIRGSLTHPDIKKLENFLKASPCLESVKMYMEYFGHMEPNFPFRLKTIVCTSHNSFEWNKNLKKFFLSQAGSVETLEAACDDPEFHELVLANCQKLRRLQSNLHKLVDSPSFTRNMKPMPFLREIKSFFGFASEAVLRAVLGNCPELVKLECPGDQNFPNHLDFVAEFNRKLELLSISTVKATSARFQCLKSLVVSQVEDADQLIAFLKENPTIDTFEIRYLDEEEMGIDSITALINETSLIYVQIEGDDTAINRVYQVVKEAGFGTWKTLQLSINDGSSTGMPIYNFVFPEDPNEWTPPENLSDNQVEYHD